MSRFRIEGARRRLPQRLLWGGALVFLLALCASPWFASVRAAPNAPIGTIRIIKTVVPGAVNPDPGVFRIKFNELAEQNTCPGTCDVTHDVFVSPVSIGEEAASGTTNLADYTTTIACYDNAAYPGGQPFLSSSSQSLSVPIDNTHPNVTCVITNTRKTGKLWVKKLVVDPSSPSGTNGDTFGLLINNVAVPGAFGNGQSSAPVTVNAGMQSASESPNANYNTSITCYRVDKGVITNIAVAGPVSGTTINNVPVNDTDNKEVACVFINTRKVGKLEVKKKVISPAGFPETGKFDLKIDGNTLANDVGQGGSTGQQTVAIGAHTVTESVDDPNTNAANYTSVLACYTRASYNTTNPQPLFTPASSGAANVSAPVAVAEGDDIVCEITNTRKSGKLQIKKVVRDDPPNTTPGRFNLTIKDANGNVVTTAADQEHGGATTLIDVPSGTYKVEETAGTATSLAKYDSALSCVGNATPPVVLTPTAATITVGNGETIICTFENRRRQGKLTVIKDFKPDSSNAALSGDDFWLQVDGTNRTPFINEVPNPLVSAMFPAGQHTIAEIPANATTNLADYAISIVCKDQGGAGGVVASSTDAGPLSLFVDSNADIVCTITNKAATIEIAKETNPASPPQTFGFTVTGPGLSNVGFNVTSGIPANTGPIVPGTYIYTETPIPSDWILTDIVCVGNAKSTITKNLAANNVTINLVAGEDVRCTFKNARRSTITIQKDAYPADGTDFMFKVNGNSHGPIDDAVPDDNDSHADLLSLANLVPGLYNIDEDLAFAPGWGLTDRTCKTFVLGSNRQTPINPDPLNWVRTPTGVTLVLPGNVEVVCTFKNEKRATLTIRKLATPADGADFKFTGTAPLGAFTLDYAAPNDNDAFSNSQTFTNLPPGAYNVVEALPAGWEIPTVSCSSDQAGGNNDVSISNGVIVNLEAAENVICTFDNQIKRGSITVIKEPFPADGTDFAFSGSAPLGAFALDAGDNDAVPGSKSFTSLLPGSYDITEQVPADWNLTALSCTGHVGADNNTALPNGVRVALDPGEQIVCTFRNVIKQSGITIIKDSLPADPMNFTIDGGVLGSIVLDDANPDDGDNVPSSKSFTNLNPGVYTFAEPRQAIPAGWDLIDLKCSGAVNSQITYGANQVSINLKPNEQIVCVFTNAKRGSVKIIKEVAPASGDDFPFSFTGTNVIFPTPLNEAFTLDVDGISNNPHADNKTFFDLPPGDYRIVESVPAGWSVTGRTCTGAVNSQVVYSGDGKTVDIKLAPAENVVCTYKNSKQGSITIVKDVEPASATDFFKFTTSLNPPVFLLNDADPTDYIIGVTPVPAASSKTFSNLAPGVYTVAEEAPTNGWNLRRIQCIGGANMIIGPTGDYDVGDSNVTINLGAGENVICEFFNKFEVATGLSLQKTVNPSSYSKVGDVLNYTFIIKNIGNAPLTGVTLKETLPNVQITSCTIPTPLASQQSVTCTGKYTITQADLDRGSVTNSATAKSESPAVTSNIGTATAYAVQTPLLSLIKSYTDNNGGVVQQGDTLTYKFEVTNIGNTTLSNVSVADPLAGLGLLSCTPAQPATLAPGAKLTCTASYVVTQADAQNGIIKNTATAQATGAANATASVTVNVARTLSLDLNKTLKANADNDGSGTVSLNDILTFEFVVTNNSNVALTNVQVSDPLAGLSGLACTPAQGATLQPGHVMKCTATYQVTQANLDQGRLDNTATASGKDSNSSPVSDQAAVTINIPRRSSIDIQKSIKSTQDRDNSGSVTQGDILTYQFVVTNDGNVTLSGVTVSDLLPGISAINCGAFTGVLSPGQSATCTATYTVTATDVNVGTITNNARATGTAPNGVQVVNSDQVSEIVKPNPKLGLAKRIAAVDPQPDNSVVIVLEYTLQNFGNGVLTDLGLFDDVVGKFGAFNPAGFATVDGSLITNRQWSGKGDSNILAPFQALGVGAKGTALVSFKIAVDQPVTIESNAQAAALTTLGDPVNDLSTDGDNPDENADSNPDEQAPTVVKLTGQTPDPASATVSGLRAEANSNGVLVQWATLAESGIKGFRLYRSTDGDRAHAVVVADTILSHGVATGSDYRFTDADVQAGTTYTYWLAVLADDVVIDEHGPVTATIQVDPDQPAPTLRFIYLPVIER